MTSSEEIQRAIYAALTGTPAIMALAHRVYEDVPHLPFGAKDAYISFGPCDSVEDDAECISGVEHTLQIDVWSKTPGQLECKTLTDLVRKKLHRQPLAITENVVVDTWVELTRIIPDPGRIHHGVVQVRCMVEEPE